MTRCLGECQAFTTSSFIANETLPWTVSAPAGYHSPQPDLGQISTEDAHQSPEGYNRLLDVMAYCFIPMLTTQTKGFP